MALGMKRWAGGAFGRVGTEDGLFLLQGVFQPFTITQGLFLICPRADLLRDRPPRPCSSNRGGLLVRLSYRGLEVPLLV